MVVSSSSQRRWQTAVISDILSWLQAFSIYTAILVSADATTKKETAGLAAHNYILNDTTLEGSQRPSLAQIQPELPWVGSSKRYLLVGEIIFFLYGRCLAHNSWVHAILPTLRARALREEPLQRFVTTGMMEYTVTALLATFITVAAGVGKPIRPQCVLKHHNMPREGCDILTMLHFYS